MKNKKTKQMLVAMFWECSYKMLSSLAGPLYFSPKCRKHVYRLYHHTRDCTIPACKANLYPALLTLLSRRCSQSAPTHAQISRFLPRLQTMRAASHTTSRQPAVHRGVAHSRYGDALRLPVQMCV